MSKGAEDSTFDESVFVDRSNGDLNVSSNLDPRTITLEH